MRIRITGTPAELELAVQAVAAVLPVVTTSAIHRNHNEDTAYVILEVGPVQTTPMNDEDGS